MWLCACLCMCDRVLCYILLRVAFAVVVMVLCWSRSRCCVVFDVPQTHYLLLPLSSPRHYPYTYIHSDPSPMDNILPLFCMDSFENSAARQSQRSSHLTTFQKCLENKKRIPCWKKHLRMLGCTSWARRKIQIYHAQARAHTHRAAAYQCRLINADVGSGWEWRT